MGGMGPGQQAVSTSSTSLDGGGDGTGTMGSTSSGRWKVSAKIQQLLNTLKRPKRRPLPEFYEDDDIELELAANPKDPNAPKPEGGPMTPALGEQLIIPSGLPRSLEAAVQRYGSSSYKAPAATVLDPNGKMSTTLTYGMSCVCPCTWYTFTFVCTSTQCSSGLVALATNRISTCRTYLGVSRSLSPCATLDGKQFIDQPSIIDGGFFCLSFSFLASFPPSFSV